MLHRMLIGHVKRSCAVVRVQRRTDCGNSLARRRVCAAYVQAGWTFSGRRACRCGEPAAHQAGREHRCPMTLDDEDIEQIARRVAELIGSAQAHTGPRYVDASDLARMLGIERDWVYAHAVELGAIRLGGPRGRLRFDVGRVTEALTRPNAGRSLRRGSSRRGGSRAPTAGVIQYER
jgi:hypothetical protein